MGTEVGRVRDSDLVVVLGAGPGLGRAVGAAFAKRGARVVLVARDRERLERLVTAIAGVSGIAADVADEPALLSAFASIRSEHGDPTVLVHNPSIAYESPASRTPRAALMDGFALAAGSLLVAAQEVLPAMRASGRGTILVTGSGSAKAGSTWSAALAAQKAAVRNLSFSLAAELAPEGIHVVTITIAGNLGTPGFEHDRIAALYVRLHDATDTSGPPWAPEINWPNGDRADNR